jgi:hypothetical protein
MDKKHYPTIHISGEESLGLPKSGTATIRFRVVEESESHRGGKENYSCVLEVLTLSDVAKTGRGDNPKSGSEAEDALDKLAKAKNSDYEEE